MRSYPGSAATGLPSPSFAGPSGSMKHLVEVALWFGSFCCEVPVWASAAATPLSSSSGIFTTNIAPKRGADAIIALT